MDDSSVYETCNGNDKSVVTSKGRKFSMSSKKTDNGLEGREGREDSKHDKTPSKKKESFVKKAKNSPERKEITNPFQKGGLNLNEPTGKTSINSLAYVKG